MMNSKKREGMNKKENLIQIKKEQNFYGNAMPQSVIDEKISHYLDKGWRLVENRKALVFISPDDERCHSYLKENGSFQSLPNFMHHKEVE